MTLPSRPILVVEDDETIRLAVSIALEMAGYRVRLAANGRDALQHIEEEHPSLVLLDMRMPVLDGWGFVQEARARGYDPPIVVMTTRDDAPRTAEELHAVGYIGKPFHVDDLLAAVERLRVP